MTLEPKEQSWNATTIHSAHDVRMLPCCDAEQDAQFHHCMLCTSLVHAQL